MGVAAGSVLFLLQLRASGWRPPATPAIIVGTLAVAYAFVVLFGFPALEHVRPTSAVGRWIATHQPLDARVGLFQIEEWEASMRFYSNRQVEMLDDVSALQRFLAVPGPRSVVMLRRKHEALQTMGGPLRRVYGRAAPAPACAASDGEGSSSSSGRQSHGPGSIQPQTSATDATVDTPISAW